MSRARPSARQPPRCRQSRASLPTASAVRPHAGDVRTRTRRSRGLRRWGGGVDGVALAAGRAARRGLERRRLAARDAPRLRHRTGRYRAPLLADPQRLGGAVQHGACILSRDAAWRVVPDRHRRRGVRRAMLAPAGDRVTRILLLAVLTVLLGCVLPARAEAQTKSTRLDSQRGAELSLFGGAAADAADLGGSFGWSMGWRPSDRVAIEGSGSWTPTLAPDGFAALFGPRIYLNTTG